MRINRFLCTVDAEVEFSADEIDLIIECARKHETSTIRLLSEHGLFRDWWNRSHEGDNEGKIVLIRCSFEDLDTAATALSAEWEGEDQSHAATRRSLRWRVKRSRVQIAEKSQLMTKAVNK